MSVLGLRVYLRARADDFRLRTSRHAHYSLGDFKAAAEAFRRGLNVDPNNASLKTGLTNAEARIVPEENFDDMPPLEPPSARGGAGSDVGAGAGGLGGMADMLRNMGMGGGAGGAGGGAGGGMPDLAGLLNNPAMMAAAQQMMQNGGLERLMQNPALANMVRTPYARTGSRCN